MGQGRAGRGGPWDLGVTPGVCVLLAATGLAWGGLLGVLLGRHASLSRDIRYLRERLELLEGNGSALSRALGALEGNQTRMEQRNAETAALLQLVSANQTAARFEVSVALEAVRRDRGDTRAALDQLLEGVWRHNDSGCSVCPPGWQLHGGSCYWFGRGPEGWAQAQRRCRDRGGDLVVIGDHDEQIFLSRMSPPHDSWIGLHDRSSEGTFVWVDGTPVTYRNWRWNQPDDARGGEDCAAMAPHGLWDDEPCASAPGGWVCERAWAC